MRKKLSEQKAEKCKILSRQRGARRAREGCVCAATAAASCLGGGDFGGYVNGKPARQH